MLAKDRKEFIFHVYYVYVRKMKKENMEQEGRRKSWVVSCWKDLSYKKKVHFRVLFSSLFFQS